MAICGAAKDQCSNKNPNFAVCREVTPMRHHPSVTPSAMLTVFSLGFARSSGSSSPVPVRWRPEEVAVLAVAPVGAIVLPRLMRGKRRGARPPVSPVRRSPVGFTLLAEAFFWLVAFQAIHHFNGHLCKRNKVSFKTLGVFQMA